MKATDKPKKKPNYSVWQNTFYMLGQWWRSNRKELTLAFLQVPAMVLASFLGILLPKVVIDCLQRQTGAQELVLTVGGFALALCFCNWLQHWVQGRMSSIALNARMSFLCQMLHYTLHMDYEDLESPKGQMRAQRAMHFINNNSSGGEAVVRTVISLLTNILGLVLYGSVLSLLNPLVIALLAALSLLIFFVTRAVQRYEYRQRENWTAVDHKLWYLYEKPQDFAAGKDIRIYRIKNWFADQFRKVMGERMYWQKRIRWSWFGVDGLEGLLNFLRDGLAYAYLIYLVVQGALSVGDFTLYFGAVTGFSTWVSGIAQNAGELSRISLECCDFRELLDAPSHFSKEGLTVEGALHSPCEIVFDDVSFQYDGAQEPTLRHVSFTLRPGEKVAMVGLNGAGKTTCVKLLCGLYRPTGGRILINGVDMLQYRHEDYYRLFTAVFQELNFLPLSVEQNVALCAPEEIDRAKLARCLQMAGMEERISRLPLGERSLMNKEVNLDAVNFSGGELQRLLLARALYKDAPVLILDEPTAALDPIAENELYQRYGQLTEEKTSLFISHRLSSTRFCDRILFLEKGAVVEEGTHDQLMEQGGRYAQLYEVQSHYYQEHPDMQPEEGGAFCEA